MLASLVGAAAPFQIDLSGLGDLPGGCPGWFYFLSFPTQPSTETVKKKQLHSWSNKDFRDRFGKPVVYLESEYGGVKPAYAPQTMTPIRDLDESEQRLIYTLLKRAKDITYKTPPSPPRPKLKAEPEGEFDPFDPWLLTIAESEAQRIHSNVEFGVWRVVLKSGKELVALHTSRDEMEVDRAHSMAAINGVLARYDVAAEDIQQIDLLRNHSTNYGYSKDLIQLTRREEDFGDYIRSFLDRSGGRHVAFSNYAVFESRRGLIIRTGLTHAHPEPAAPFPGDK